MGKLQKMSCVACLVGWVGKSHESIVVLNIHVMLTMKSSVIVGGRWNGHP